MPIFIDPNFPRPGDKITRVDKAKPTWKPPLTPRSQSAIPSATVAAPLKVALPLEATAGLPVIEPYNPYPPRKRTTPQPQSQMRTANSLETWTLFALTGVLVLAGALLISTFFIQKAAERQVRKSIAKAMLPMESVASVEIGSAKVSLFRQSLRLNDVRIEIKENEMHAAQTVTIAHASLWGIDWKSMKQIAITHKVIVPETMRVSLDGVHLDAAVLGAQGQAFLQSMGYKDLAFSLSAGVNLNKARKSFDLENLQIEAAKIGRVDISLSLGNLSVPTPAEIARLKADPKLILTETGEFTKATIKGFEFGFEDSSFTNRANEALIKMGEMSPVTLTEMAIEVNTTDSKIAGSKTPSRGVASTGSDFVRPALETLLRFLKNPTSITLSAHPAKPIPVLSLFDGTSGGSAGGSINELAHRLNMSVE